MKLDEVLRGSYQRYIAEDFLSTAFFDKGAALIIDMIDDVAPIRQKLLDAYGDVDVTAEVDDREFACKVSELCGEVDSVVIDSCPLTQRQRFGFSDFVEIMKRLRAPDGCVWDRAQTHESIRINLIEEAYELVEAIDMRNADMMREECGDVLMQAIFHTAIADENGEFDYYDMLTELCRKLIDRHTHIFGSDHADDPEQALKFWTEAKKKEKKYVSTADAMDRVPKDLPSLLYAEKVQKLAKKSGFDWDSVDGAIEKLKEELDELQNADEAHRNEEAGDLLFAAVNVLRFYKVEPEMALREAAAKFLRRFDGVEKRVAAEGKQMTDLTLKELDAFWEQVKLEERNSAGN